MLKLRLGISFGLSLVFLASEAFAQRGPGGQGGGRQGGFDFFKNMPFLQALDTNKDGELSSGEIEKAAVALRSLDENGDGKLTLEEVRPAGGRPADGRGQGNAGQGVPRGRPDGGQAQRGGRRANVERGERSNGPPAGRSPRARTGGTAEPSVVSERVDRIMALDSNEDGALSKDEIGAELLERADSDRSGSASQEEIRAIVAEEAQNR